VGEPPQNRKHAFELGLGKVCFDGLCPKVSALLSSNVWMLVTVRLSKQTQLQGSLKIVCASNIIDAHATANNIFHIQILVFSGWTPKLKP
jgi:hypothetical protein